MGWLTNSLSARDQLVSCGVRIMKKRILWMFTGGLVLWLAALAGQGQPEPGSGLAGASDPGISAVYHGLCTTCQGLGQGRQGSECGRGNRRLLSTDGQLR